MRRWKWPIVILLFATLCWRFPLFQVVPLAKAIQDKAAATFNPAQFAETFWQTQLLKSLDKAVPTEALLPAMQADPSAARKKYSRSVGLDDSTDLHPLKVVPVQAEIQ
jgi:hypothetical protein